MNRDFVFGAAAVVIAAGYYLLAARIPPSALADAVGPQGLPKAYAIVLLFLSLILVTRSFGGRDPGSGIPDLGPGTRDQRDRRSPGPRIPDPVSRVARVAGILVIGMAYIAVVPWLGYVATLAGLVFATTWYQGGIVNRHVAIVSIAGAIFFWLLFVQLLGIPHPAGIWASFF